MATDQMEEICIGKHQDRAIKEIIERYPFSNLYVEGDGCVLRVIAPYSLEYLAFPGEHFGDAWKELMQSVVDFGYYGRELPHHSYHWINREHRREWTLSHKK